LRFILRLREVSLLEHIADEGATGGDSLADRRYELLEALTGGKPRLSIIVEHRGRVQKLEVREQSKAFCHDLLIARKRPLRAPIFKSAKACDFALRLMVEQLAASPQ
jgi:hypothetical protein